MAFLFDEQMVNYLRTNYHQQFEKVLTAIPMAVGILMMIFGMQSNKQFSDGYLGSLDRLDTTTRRPDAQPSSIDPKALAYADWDSEFSRLYVSPR